MVISLIILATGAGIYFALKPTIDRARGIW